MTATPSDPRCVAIRGRYGTTPDFIRRWSPVSLAYISSNMKRALASGVPSMVMVMKTYGGEAVGDVFTSFTQAAATRLGDVNLDRVDFKSIVDGMLRQPAARTVSFPLVLHFFTRLSRGDFQLYGFKPLHVLNAFKAHCHEMQSYQSRVMAEIDTERERTEHERHARSAITFEEYARRKGIAAASPLDIVKRSKPI